MAQVEISSEVETASAWVFIAQVLDDVGILREHRVTLSWADYNLWSGSGADDPAAVASAVIDFLLTRIEPGALRPSFDASLARRLYAEADAEVPRFITDRH